MGKELQLGAPVALQEVFVGTSFIVIQSVVNSFGVGVLMLLVLFFKGNVLAAIFSKEPAVVAAAHSYLKAYAVDLFHIGLGTPASSLVQILLCVGYYWYLNRQKPARQ